MITMEKANILAREEATFLTLHTRLQKQYAGQYVAIHQTDVVDNDADLTTLSERIYEKFGNTPIWIALVREQVVEEWVFRSPRIVQ